MFRLELGAFLRAVFRGWVTYTTGGAVVAVVGTYVATASPPVAVARAGAFLVLGFAIVAGFFRAWRDEYRKRVVLERVPQLRIVFEPGVAPFEQEFPVPDGIPTVRHYFRVGLVHDGHGTVEDAEVLLASVDPGIGDLPLMHPLRLMGSGTGVGSATIGAGTDPTRFFDFLVEVRHLITVATPE